jgi:hypothetical protein
LSIWWVGAEPCPIFFFVFSFSWFKIRCTFWDYCWFSIYSTLQHHNYISYFAFLYFSAHEMVSSVFPQYFLHQMGTYMSVLSSKNCVEPRLICLRTCWLSCEIRMIYWI